jgi:hypothetical protein
MGADVVTSERLNPNLRSSRREIIQSTLGCAIAFLAPPNRATFRGIRMSRHEAFWRQIHELADTVDRHAAEGESVDALANHLQALPSACRQNFQRDLHVVTALLNKLAVSRIHSERDLSMAKPLGERSEAIATNDATELENALSAPDRDGCPIAGVQQIIRGQSAANSA